MNFKKKTIITFYVNDILIIDHNKIINKRIKNTLNVKFYIFDLKPYAFYLSIIVKKNRRNNIIRLRYKIYIICFFNYFKY